MSLWNTFQQWRRRDADLDEEIRAHLSMAEQDRIERGESPKDAALAAHREFGNPLLVKEVTRGVWGWGAVERSFEDLKYAFRQMRRSPGFTLVAILTLALGLGATTAMFSIVNGVLLTPLKFPEPDRLYMAQTIVAPRFKANGPWPVNARHFHEWRTHGQSWEQIALFFDGRGATLTGTGEPQRVGGLGVSHNFLKTLGIQPALGRDFRPEEELPGNSNVVILSDSLWQNRFASDPSIVGQSILLDGAPNLVIGIMPELRLPNIRNPMILRPLGFDVSQARGYGQYNFYSVVRLRPGIQPQAAIAEMNALIADLVRQFKIESKPGMSPLLDWATADVMPALWLLLGTVGAVLLIVCVNIGNLMLLRTGGRLREAGVRMALGASRQRLFGLALTEAVALVAIGGVLGLFLADAAIRAFAAFAPVSLPRLDEVRIDWRVLLFASAAMALSTLICGFVPAWRLSKTAPLDALKAGSANVTELGRRLRLREAIVGLEVALSTLLLVVGGLLVVSFVRVIAADKGFDVARVISQDFALTNSKYANRQSTTRFIREALPQLASLPGVEAVSVTNQAPLRGQNSTCGLRDPDHLPDSAHPDAASNFAGLANYQFVAPGFWKTMGIPIIRGSALEERDRDRRVAVVSERVARTLWPDQNPIGRHVMTCGSAESATLEVVGVVGDARATAEQEPPLTIYQPYWDTGMGGGSFVLRTKADPSTVMGALHKVLRSLDPDLPLAPAQTMVQVLDESVAPRRFEMYLAVAFAVAALVLASFGIYGIVSFTVARRTPEIGIRLALGAEPRQLVAMVLRQGLLPVVGGLTAGLIGALGIGRFLASQLFGVSPSDPLTISIVTMLLLIVAVGACLIPARRAIRIDPVRALRFE
jgi:predicted permease